MLEQVLLFACVGFLAQIVDGALGMAYGLVSTSVMLSLGITPAVASASVHAAEVFTTGASGLSHWRLGNVDRALLWRLAVPGMIGGALGAFVLVSVPGDQMKPYVSAYLLAVGLYILWKAWKGSVVRKEPPRHVPALGLSGGFVDAVGGGGWGPIVTSSLIGNGCCPRQTIGSVSLSEFFVTATVSATFVATIGLELWPIITGLVLGGVLAAPLAALAVRALPRRPLMIMVGVLVLALSVRGLVRALA